MNHLKYIVIFSLSVLIAPVMAAGGHAGNHNQTVNSIGQAGKTSKVSRVIKIDMTNAMKFTPESINVKQNETVRFVIKNSGRIKHELVFGSEKQLKEHYEMMKKTPNMNHADENQVTVMPGKTGEIIWQFSKPGVVKFGCLQPGHYDAGMKGTVVVSNIK